MIVGVAVAESGKAIRVAKDGLAKPLYNQQSLEVTMVFAGDSIVGVNEVSGNSSGLLQDNQNKKTTLMFKLKLPRL